MKSNQSIRPETLIRLPGRQSYQRLHPDGAFRTPNYKAVPGVPSVER